MAGGAQQPRSGRGGQGLASTEDANHRERVVRVRSQKWMDESRNREMNCLFGLGESERRAAAFDETLRVRYLTPTMKHQRPAHPPLTAARALACSVRASCSSKQGGAGARTRPQLLYLFAVRFAQERDGESPTRVVIVPDTPHSPCRCG